MSFTGPGMSLTSPGIFPYKRQDVPYKRRDVPYKSLDVPYKPRAVPYKPLDVLYRPRDVPYKRQSLNAVSENSHWFESRQHSANSKLRGFVNVSLQQVVYIVTTVKQHVYSGVSTLELISTLIRREVTLILLSILVSILHRYYLSNRNYLSCMLLLFCYIGRYAYWVGVMTGCRVLLLLPGGMLRRDYSLHSKHVFCYRMLCNIGLAVKR